MTEHDIEAVCRKWYGKKWDDPDPNNRPGEKMKDVWRNLARKAVEAIDEVRQCKHLHLTFGSGGFYVFCRDCNASWVARKAENDELDYTRSNEGLTTGDFRNADGEKDDKP